MTRGKDIFKKTIKYNGRPTTKLFLKKWKKQKGLKLSFNELLCNLN